MSKETDPSRGRASDRPAERVLATYMLGNVLAASGDKSERAFMARQQLDALTGPAGDQIARSIKQLASKKINGLSERIDAERFKEELIGYLSRFLECSPI